MEKKASSKGKKIVTIDGPAGAGKSTVGKMLARALRYLYLDTGAMYRAVAVRVQQTGINPDDEKALTNLCRNITISFRRKDDKQRVILNGEDVTAKIREPEIGWLASKVSIKRPVREAMVKQQREIGTKGKIVAEGRDTGTVVFPGAPYKFYLTATPGERARRRHQELRAKGLSPEFKGVEKEMAARDAQDSSRDLAPLRPALDAVIIDSTGLTPQEIVKAMVQMIKKGKTSEERES